MSLCIIPFMVLLEYISTIKGIMKIKQRVQAILASRPVFLDTETTGFDHTARVVEIAVINFDGRVLLNTLIKPTISIPPDATAIHGISDADVAHAPLFTQVSSATWTGRHSPTVTEYSLLPQFLQAISGRHVVIYNSQYDMRIMRQSAPHCFNRSFCACEITCAMLLYAEFWGDYNTYHHSYRWQSLSDAARQQNLILPPNMHRALADARLTRSLMLKMGRIP